MKTRLFLFFALTLIFASCKDEENTSEGKKVQYFESAYVPKLENVPDYFFGRDIIYTSDEMSQQILNSPFVKNLPKQTTALLPLMIKNIYSSAQEKVSGKLNRTDFNLAYRDLIIYYISQTPNGNTVQLSGRALLGGFIVDGEFYSMANEIVIAMPYTRTNGEACATRTIPIEVIAGPEALVIVPDILGYGQSRDYATPYLFNETAGREGYELTAAVLDFLTSNGVSFPSDLKTYTCGASQGGGYALGVQKMLEGVYPKSGEALHFKGSYLASGAFDPSVTFNTFTTTRRDSIMGEPAALPMLYLAAKEYYPEIMKDITPDMILKKELVESGVLDMIKQKSYDTEIVNDKIKEACGDSTFASMLSETFVEGDQAFDAFRKVFADQSTLLSGWTPKTNIRVMFSESDESVPFENFNALENAFPNKVIRIPVEATTHAETCLQMYLGLLNHKYRE